jgi:hypothetical protein
MLGRFGKGRALMLALFFARAGCADEILSFSDLSSQDKLRAQAAVLFGDDVASVQANVTLEGKNGKVRVLPKVASRFSSGDWLDVSSVVTFGDWNSPSATYPSIATKIVLRSSLSAIERIEGDIRHTAKGVRQSFRLGFTDVGIDRLAGTPIKLKTALTLQSGGPANAFSNLSSSISVGRALAVDTAWQFAGDGYDTRLSYKASTVFVEQVIAGLKRTPDGKLAQSIGVRFPSVSRVREVGPEFKLTSGAALEETLDVNGVESLRMAFEAGIAGLRSAFLGGTSKLSLKLEQPLDEARAERASLAYDHAWAPRDATSIALNLKMERKTGDLQPTLGLDWSSRF